MVALLDVALILYFFALVTGPEGGAPFYRHRRSATLTSQCLQECQHSHLANFDGILLRRITPVRPYQAKPHQLGA